MSETHLAIIARLSFRFAKTMPQTPHEYTVRTPETEAAYVAIYDAIQRDGVDERYNGRKKKYLYPGALRGNGLLHENGKTCTKMPLSTGS